MTIKPQEKDEDKQTKQAEKKRPEGIPTEANFENSKRFGKKVGQHMEDLGLNAKLSADREKFKAIINETIQGATKIKRGYYTKEEQDVICYQKEDMVILTKPNGDIITAYTQTIDIKQRPMVETRRWYQEMKTIFDIKEQRN